MKQSALKFLSLVVADFGSLDSLFWRYRQSLSDLFVVTCGLYYVFCAVYSLTFIDIDGIQNEPTIKELAHGLFKCISVWNYILQITFYIALNITRLLQRIYPHQKRLVALATSTSHVVEQSFLSAVFPLSLFVCNTFWYIYNTNRELIYPPVVEELMADWYNHTLHTIPVFIVFLHILLVQPKSAPLPIRTSVFIQCGFHAFYLSMLLLLRYLDGVWLYKFLGYYAATRTSQIVAALLFSFVSPTIYVWIGYKTNAEVQQTVSKVNKKNNLQASAKVNNNNNDLKWKLK